MGCDDGAGTLILNDRKLFNILLARSQGRHPDEAGMLTIPVRTVIRYMPNKSLVRLSESLKRLTISTVSIDYIDDGVPESVRGHYLAFARVERGLLTYALDPVIVNRLESQEVYGLMTVDKVSEFRSIHSLKLFEVLSLFINRPYPVWRVTIEDFRKLMGVETTYPLGGSLRQNLIVPSVDEVVRVMGVNVNVSFVRRYNHVDEIIFSTGKYARAVKKRVGRIASRTPLVRRVYSLTPTGLSHACLLAGDRATAEAHFRAWKVEMTDVDIDSVDVNFLTWLEKKLRLSRKRPRKSRECPGQADLADLEIDFMGVKRS